MDLPVLGGQDWLWKCGKYFEIYVVLNDQKVDLASLYLIKQVEYWFTRMNSKLPLQFNLESGGRCSDCI